MAPDPSMTTPRFGFLLSTPPGWAKGVIHVQGEAALEVLQTTLVPVGSTASCSPRLRPGGAEASPRRQL